jgi:hypothetical protein
MAIAAASLIFALGVAAVLAAALTPSTTDTDRNT